MSLYEDLSKEELIDLLNAYNNYIINAVENQVFSTGWSPVCIEEFFGSEYQNIWKMHQDFSDYFIDTSDMAAKRATAHEIALAIDAFYQDYDFYKYQDQIDNREAAVAALEDNILSVGAQNLIDHLNDEMESYGETDRFSLAAQLIIAQLRKFQEQNHQAKELDSSPDASGLFADWYRKSPPDRPIDIWVVDRDNGERQFHAPSHPYKRTAQHTSSREDNYSPMEEWLLSLPVENTWLEGDGLETVILRTEFSNDQMLFLMNDNNDNFMTDKWATLSARADMAGAAFEDRLAFLKQGIPFEKPFDGFSMDAIDHDGRQALCSGLRKHSEVYIGRDRGLHQGITTAPALFAYYIEPEQDAKRGLICKRICDIKATVLGHGLSSSVDGKLALAIHACLKAKQHEVAQANSKESNLPELP